MAYYKKGVSLHFNHKIRLWIKQRSALYCSAFLVGIILITPGVEWIMLTALIPMIHYVYLMPKLTFRQVRIDFYWFGIIISGFANYFLLEASPNNWTVSFRGWFAFIAPIIAWLMIIATCALAFLALGELLRRIPSNLHRLALLPIAYGAAELLKSYLYAAMAYAPHGSFSPNFNWGSLAVPTSGTALVYTSRFVGFFGLTFIVIVINISIYMIFKKRRLLIAATMICTITIFSVLSIFTAPKPPESVRSLRIFAANFSENESVEHWSEVDWPPKGIDLLVLPEYSGLLENPNYKYILQRLSDSGIVVTTQRSGISPGGTNQLIAMNRNGEIIYKQDKTFLIPTGETLPYSLQYVFKFIKKSNAITDFTYTQQIRAGHESEKPFVYNDITFGALACSGISALNEYNRLSREGADILINSASLSFLKPNSRYHVYADNMARFQSFSTGKPLVQSSRSGNSYIIGF